MFELERKLVMEFPEGTHIPTMISHAEKVIMEIVYIQARYNQSKAAIALGMSRCTFRTKMKEYFSDKYIL